MAFELPPLPYSFYALEPAIDRLTMEIHHDRHHGAYVKNLNAALEKHSNLQSQSAEYLISNLSSLPEDIRTAVRNNGGGHVNHSMFWRIMTPQGGAPDAAISQAIEQAFGGLDDFKTKFNDAGAKHFGSGWVWLVRGRDAKLQIITTPNQDNPLMQGLYPILGNDLWEHAYYLKYQNKRPDYLAAWWKVVNWKEIAQRLQESEQHFKKIAA